MCAERCTGCPTGPRKESRPKVDVVDVPAATTRAGVRGTPPTVPGTRLEGWYMPVVSPSLLSLSSTVAHDTVQILVPCMHARFLYYGVSASGGRWPTGHWGDTRAPQSFDCHHGRIAKALTSLIFGGHLSHVEFVHLSGTGDGSQRLSHARPISASHARQAAHLSYHPRECMHSPSDASLASGPPAHDGAWRLSLLEIAP